jgi:arylsulfatase
MRKEARYESRAKAGQFKNGRKLIGTFFAAALVATSLSPFARSPALAQAPSTALPNILVIFGDDVGQSNISAYTDGLMGYRTPNIDRIAKEGMRLTDYYAENSCTAAARRSSRGRFACGPGFARSASPAPPSACRIAT